MKKVYYKEIPAFITKIINHIGYQQQIFQVKEMYSLNYENFSKEEEKVKDYLDTYIYLINNCANIINYRIIAKSIFILNSKKINEEKVRESISNFISIKEEVSISKIIKLSDEISNLIKNHKDRYIYFLMLINYLLLHYNYKAIKYYEQDFKELDEYIKKYQRGETSFLEKYLTYKEERSRDVDTKYYQNLKEVRLEEIIDFIKEKEELFKEKYQVFSLAIFGSFAKGKEKKDSDIDLLIKFKPYIPLLKRNNNIQEIQEIIYKKFNRFCDIHIEREILTDHEIKIFKENIKII